MVGESLPCLIALLKQEAKDRLDGQYKHSVSNGTLKGLKIPFISANNDTTFCTD